MDLSVAARKILELTDMGATSLLPCLSGTDPTGPAFDSLPGDLDRWLVGSIFVLLGGTTLLALATVRRFRERSLLDFGSVCTLYGARLLIRIPAFDLLLGLKERPLLLDALLTYLIPVPFYLYAEAILGAGWKSSIRRLWQVHLAYAAAGVVYELAIGRPFQAETPYQILVLAGQVVLLGHLFRPSHQTQVEHRRFRRAYLILIPFIINENLVSLGLVPWRIELEHLGALIFLGFLGFISVQRVFDNEAKLATLNYELATARNIQRSILPHDMPCPTGFDLCVRYIPATTVAGDLYDFVKLPGDRLGVLIADVCGHGIPAALVGAMVKVALSSEISHGGDPAKILAGVNRILCGNLGSSFLTAAYFVLEPGKQRLVYAGAAHPPLVVMKTGTGDVTEIPRSGGLVGPFPDLACQNRTLELSAGDRIIAYTDGLVEAGNQDGEAFGQQRLISFVREMRGMRANPFADALIERLRSWRGREKSADSFDDDLTLIVVDVLGSSERVTSRGARASQPTQAGCGPPEVVAPAASR